MDALFAVYKFQKAKQWGQVNILSISQIIFHKGRAPVTFWEVVVHHLGGSEWRDGWHPLVDTLWHLIFLS